MRTLSSVALIVAVTLLGPSLSLAQERKTPMIEPALPGTNVFGGKDADTPREVEFPLIIRTSPGFKGQLLWNFVLDRATIQAQALPLAAEAKPSRVTLGLRVPFVRDGLVVKGRLDIELMAEGEKKVLAHYEQPIWVFPEQPFTQRSTWLKDLHLTLFDPRETTAPLLKKLSVPFEQVQQAQVLDEVKQGLIVVGEGVSFEDDKDLPEVLLRAAARGRPVLCLAPVKGLLPLPGADNPAALLPRSLCLHRTEIIAQLDPHLDVRGWPPDGKVVASSMALKAVEGSVLAEVTDAATGWPWLEVSYANRGRLLICGFGLTTHWDASPTPRYLFARMLQRLTETKSPE